MPAAAAIGGIASGVGGIIGAGKASDAAEAQARAQQQALQFQQQVYGEAKANLSPFITTGQGANNSLASLFGLNGQPADYSSFYNSPNYQFALQQGQNATQNLAAKTGTLQSGAGLQALENFGQGLASQQYGNYVNQLMGLSGQGVQAGASLNGTSANMANTIGNTYGAIGQADASGIVGQANAINGALGGIAKSAQYMNLGGNSSYAGTPAANTFGGTGFNLYGPTGGLY